jgi:uncharacterized protein YdgA (DUF945 family)
MKIRQLPIAFLAVVVLAVLVAGPWFLGERAERVYRDELAALQRQSKAPRIVSETYRRGWFHSEASIELRPATGDLAEDLRLHIDSRISHGPRALVDLTWPPALARVDSTLQLEHPALHLSGVQADTRIGWNGEGLTRIALPGLNQPASGGKPGLRTAAGHGELRMNPATGPVAASIDIPSLEVLGEGGAILVSLRDLHAANTILPWLPGLRIASGDLRIGQVRAEGPDGPTEARDLSLSVESRPKGGLLDVHLSYRAGVLRIGGADYAPSQADFSATRLDGATLAALQRDLEGLSGKNLPEAMVGIATAAIMMQHLPALAAVDPGIALDRLDIATPSGPVTGRVVLGVKGLTAADIDSRGTWMRRLVGEGELSLPRAVALAVLTAAQRQKTLDAAEDSASVESTPEQEQAMADAAAMQIDDLVQEGWIAADGERLQTVLKLADGLLTVNGKTLPIGGAMPL